jgi:hypothetical protein
MASSDRLWLACRDTAVYASVPAANAVWQLDALDGLLLAVVARVPSPTALTFAPTDTGDVLLQVASGRPVVRMLSYAVSANPADVYNVGAFGVPPLPGALKSVMALAPGLLTSINDRDDLMVMLRDRARTSLVLPALLPAVQKAQILLADGRTVLVNGLALSMWDGQPAFGGGSGSSALLNNGNADHAVYATTTSDDSQQLLLVDRLGTLLLFDSPAGACPVGLAQVLPPLVGDLARSLIADLAPSPVVLHVDRLDRNTPILYTLASWRQAVMWRRDLRRTVSPNDDWFMPQFCSDADAVDHAVATTWPVQRICALCGTAAQCFAATRTDAGASYHPLPAEAAAAVGWARLAWAYDDERAHLLLFLGTNAPSGVALWSLDINLDGADGWRRVWTMRAPANVVLDINYWMVEQLYDALYLLRLTAGDALVLDLWNATEVHLLNYTQQPSAAAGIQIATPPLLRFADTSLLVGAAIQLVPSIHSAGAGAEHEHDREADFCIGGLNGTREPERRRLTGGQVSTIRSLIVVGLGLMVCGVGLVVVISAHALLRTVRRYMRERAEERGRYKELDESLSSFVREPNPVTALLCGQQAQTLCFLAFCCAPRVGAWIVKLQGDVLDPARRYRRSGSSTHEEAVYEAGQPAAEASASLPPLSSTDSYHDDDAINPAKMVHVSLDDPPGPPTPPVQPRTPTPPAEQAPAPMSSPLLSELLAPPADSPSAAASPLFE